MPPLGGREKGDLMKEKAQKKQMAILSALRSSERPLSSADIARQLLAEGHDLSERTVRLYLQHMDNEGFTRPVGRKGRIITEAGIGEAEASRSFERVGFLSAKIDRMTYLMQFDLASCSGTVIINVTVADPRQVVRYADMISAVYEHGYAVGHLMALLEPGERCGETIVPDGMVGIGTVCSITLNGVLLKHGIPVHSRFGGLLELRGGKAVRFVEIITYDGTTLDPLEVFIHGGMTNYRGAITTGNGRIGSGFREFPSESRDLVADLARRLEAVGLGGFMQIGYPGQTLLDIPVSESSAGAIVIGGLNPVAILEESGVRVNSRALSGLIEYNRLFRYNELPKRLRALGLLR